MGDDSLEDPLDLSIQSAPQYQSNQRQRAKDNPVFSYSCGEGSCAEAFSTTAQLREHWNKSHGCNGVYANSTGLKLQQKKCVVSDPVNLPSFHSIDSGVSSIESRYSRSLGVPSTSSSSIRHKEKYDVKAMPSCSKPITPDTRHVIFGLPTASVALVVAAEKNIAEVDGEILHKILKEGQLWFQEYAIHSDGGGPHGSVSPSQMQGQVPIDLRDVSLTYSLGGVSNPPPEFGGSLNRKELFKGLRTFSKEHELGVLQVGNLYMALVFKNDFLYVFNPGIGTSKRFQDLSDLPEASASLRKCHPKDFHWLVDDLIYLFKLENNFSNLLEYVIIPVLISKAEEV